MIAPFPIGYLFPSSLASFVFSLATVKDLVRFQKGDDHLSLVVRYFHTPFYYEFAWTLPPSGQEKHKFSSFFGKPAPLPLENGRTDL